MAVLSALTFNQFVVPIALACFFVLLALFFLVKVRRSALKTAQDNRLTALKPPKKGQNHRSLPPRQYYLTRSISKPTAEEEHVLEVYLRLQPPVVRPLPAR